MRRRISFIEDQKPVTGSTKFEVSGDIIQLHGLQAARQERFTLSPSELPSAIWDALNELHELHVRWISPHPFLQISPFSSSLAPGLHVFYTPLRRQQARRLCSVLSRIFRTTANCTDFQSASTRPLVKSERFTASAVFQYYESLTNVSGLAAYLQDVACKNGYEPCHEEVGRLRSAHYVDFDWDAISQSVTLDLYFGLPSDSGGGQSSQGWGDRISNYTGHATTEIGIFQTEVPTEDEHISLGGVLMLAGKDKEARTTLFQFPSRHHQLPSRKRSGDYLVSILRPTGLHPKLRLSFAAGTKTPQPSCALHTYITLPSFLFVDKYQLASPNFAAANNLKALQAISGESDLEAAEWTISAWGSALLVELAPPTVASGSWSADIPLHLRYQRARATHEDGTLSAFEDAMVPWPAVFWACPSDAGFNMKTNPFDRVNLGFDTLFGPKTLFYHLEPMRNDSLVEHIAVPTMPFENAQGVEIISIVAILLGSFWTLYKLSLCFGNRKSKRE